MVYIFGKEMYSCACLYPVRYIEEREREREKYEVEMFL